MTSELAVSMKIEIECCDIKWDIRNSLRETYVFGDACSNTVWFAQETSPGNFEFAPWGESMFGNITSFGEDPDGNLFISNSNGRVRRFTGFTTDVLFETGFEQLGVR